MRYIYIVVISYDIRFNPQLTDFLNEYGKGGWELVQVIEYPYLDEPSKINYYKFYFKKSI